jgi:hypothetical protein
LAVFVFAVGLASCSDDDSPVNPQRPTKTLGITGAAGSGRVTSSDGKIDCRVANGATTGPTCSATIDSGTVTTLTAVADAGQEFIAWSGDCTGTTCQLTVTRDMSASPRFVAAQGTLTIDFVTPNADDGAIVFTVTGPTILGVSASTGIELLESRATSNSSTISTIVARGNLINAAIGQLTVRGVDADANYTTQVREVAGRASAGYKQRSDLSGYRVTVRK